MEGIEVGRMFRAPIILHWSLAIPLVFSVLTLGSYAWVTAALFAIVVLHELGHVAAASWCGMRCVSITLFALGGLASIQGFETRGTPVRQLLIALAGPFVNILLTFPLYWLMSWSQNPGVAMLLIANIGMVVLNMLPIMPLDGGRAFHSLVWFFTDRLKSLALAVRISQASALGLGCLSLYYGIYGLAAVMVFSILTAQAELDGYRDYLAYEKELQNLRELAGQDQEQAARR